MHEVNDALKKYKEWDEKLDAAIIVSVPDSKIVFEWREQAEKALRKRGEGAMSIE